MPQLFWIASIEAVQPIMELNTVVTQYYVKDGPGL